MCHCSSGKINFNFLFNPAVEKYTYNNVSNMQIKYDPGTNLVK